MFLSPDTKRQAPYNFRKFILIRRNGITKLYNEETDGVKFDTLDKICKALDCHVQDVIEYVEDDTN
ncbi:helix-turn-helix domain-containing protein [Paenibacillus polymyxa]|uniref:helix-turn-helix domain-containing protein n=1 Tax=Paenibacillus polymyxa TaxID=1406 RepID=UPI0021ADA5B7|nr:helix-turn-helix transcriptional regulator [Paenibacillus polymyxa]